MGRDEGRALLAGSIDIDRNDLTVPMQLFWCVGIVVDVDDDALPLF
jgi:hypothetical protein